jgi:hypothetical protein
MSRLPIKPSDGEYDWPDGKASSAYLRQDFLSRVRKLAPEVFEELYDNTFDIYQEIKPDYYLFSYNKLIELMNQPESVRKLIYISISGHKSITSIRSGVSKSSMIQ